MNVSLSQAKARRGDEDGSDDERPKKKMGKGGSGGGQGNKPVLKRPQMMSSSGMKRK